MARKQQTDITAEQFKQLVQEARGAGGEACNIAANTPYPTLQEVPDSASHKDQRRVENHNTREMNKHNRTIGKAEKLISGELAKTLYQSALRVPEYRDENTQTTLSPAGMKAVLESGLVPPQLLLMATEGQVSRTEDAQAILAQGGENAQILATLFSDTMNSRQQIRQLEMGNRKFEALHNQAVHDVCEVLPPAPTPQPDAGPKLQLPDPRGR